MKKVLWLIVCLMTMVMSVNAQNDMYIFSQEEKVQPINMESISNGWAVKTYEADELIGTKSYTSLIYSTNVGSVVLWDNEVKKFRIISDDGLFDFKVTKAGWDWSDRTLFVATIGLYDLNGKLIKKKKVWFEKGANHSQAVSTAGSSGKNEGKDVITFLRNNKGYVRIVAPLSSTNLNFDIKIPCLKN